MKRSQEKSRGIARILLTVMLLLFAPYPGYANAADDEKAVLQSEYGCGEKGQQFVDQGDYESAIALLTQCVKKHPESDWLISLLGRAYYLDNRLSDAEKQFRKALAINKENQIAKKLIMEIRHMDDLLIDRSTKFWIMIGKRKVADLIVLIIGVWIGTLLTFLSSRIMGWYASKNFSRALAGKDFDKATDILENLAFEHKKEELRRNLNELLSKYPLQEVEKMIIHYVDDKTLEDKLVFFLHKFHQKKQLAQ